MHGVTEGRSQLTARFRPYRCRERLKRPGTGGYTLNPRSSPPTAELRRHPSVSEDVRGAEVFQALAGENLERVVSS